MGIFGDSQFVDLGLSVKWAKCNLGASSPHELGDLYAWGETQTKYEYVEENYKFYRKKSWNQGIYTKYGLNESLAPEDDVAHQKMGGKIRIPSAKEWADLFDYDIISTEYAYVQGRWGIRFTSLIKGFEGNSIFVPFAGCVGGILGADCSRVRNGQDRYGYYWTRNNGDKYDSDAKEAYLTNTGGGWVNFSFVTTNSRWRGYSIRAVKEK